MSATRWLTVASSTVCSIRTIVDYKFWLIEPGITYVADLTRYIHCRGIYLELDAYLGYLVSDEYNGNQRPAGQPAHKNEYAYLGLSADVIVKLNEYFSFIFGPRFVVNNDGIPTSFGSGANALGNHNSMLWWGMFLKCEL